MKFVEHADRLSRNLTSLQKRSSRLSQKIWELHINAQKQMEDLYRTEVSFKRKCQPNATNVIHFVHRCTLDTVSIIDCFKIMTHQAQFFFSCMTWNNLMFSFYADDIKAYFPILPDCKLVLRVICLKYQSNMSNIIVSILTGQENTTIIY